MNVLAGEGSYGIREPNPATRFHLWVYRARADVQAIVHTHPPAASVLAAAEQPLVVAHMDATPLFDDMAFLPDWPGLPTADREGELIAGGLGTKHAMLLAHHGLLAAGRSVAEAAFLAVFIERMARLQVDAAPLGGVKPIDAGRGAARARLPAHRPDHGRDLRRLVAPRGAPARPRRRRRMKDRLGHALEIAARRDLRHRPVRDDDDHGGRRRRPLSVQQAARGRLRAHRDDARGADLLRPAAGLEAARAHRHRHLRHRSCRSASSAASTSSPTSSARSRSPASSWLLFRRAVRVAEYGDTTSVLTLPLAPVAYLMGTMIVVTAAIHLWLIFVPHKRRRRQEHHLRALPR